jgi:hypothetical protein
MHNINPVRTVHIPRPYKFDKKYNVVTDYKNNSSAETKYTHAAHY